MNFELFNSLKNDRAEGGFVQQFINEIKECLLNSGNTKENNISKKTITKENYSAESDLEIKNTKIRQGLKQEGCIYVVVDNCLKGAYLENTETGRIYNEQDFPKGMEELLVEDNVFIYQNGQYVYDYELTGKYRDSFVSIQEAEKAQAKFSKEFNKRGLDSETTFKISSGNHQKDEIVTLSYKDKYDNIKEIEVPSLLIPYFLYDFTILKYDTKLECFYKDN